MGMMEFPKPGGVDFSCTEGRLPLVFRLRGTVINTIWWKIIIVIVWSAGICTLWINVEAFQFKFKPVLIQLMGVVCGLLLAFRSNSAYDRYWEGRKYWSTMTQAIRTLTRAIWINVVEESSSDIVEKKSAINLLMAFAISTKHYLRGEYDDDYVDYVNVPPHQKWPTAPVVHVHRSNSAEAILITDPVKLTTESETDGTGTKSPPAPVGLTARKTAPAPAPVTTPTPPPPKCDMDSEYTPLRHDHWFKAHDIATPTNIPLEITYYIGSYINSFRVRDKCDSGTISIMNSALNSLVECLTGFERILRTPIPLTYSVHLHQSIWIYIVSLPFQLVGENGWWTLPIVAITSFFLLGLLAIGVELEDPFGYDENDLPLDDFCKVLRREIEVLISHRAMVPDDWVFKKRNKPFAPECGLDANQLSEIPLEEMREMLVNRGWKIQRTNVLSQPEHERRAKSALRRQASV